MLNTKTAVKFTLTHDYKLLVILANNEINAVSTSGFEIICN